MATISGTKNNDTLNGGAGNDLLIGGAGSDTYRYGRGYGNDIIDNSGGKPSDIDTLQLVGLNPADIRLYRIGNDLVLTVLAGGATLTVRQYFLDANHQIDRISFAGGAVWNTNDIAANLWFPAVSPGSGNDQINGNPTDDLLQGLGGNDRLFGYGGNDTLDGGTGADYMAGGIGNDTYIIDNSGDVVVEAAGQGTDTVRSSISYRLGANVENLELTGSANLNGTGNSLDNRLTGNSGNNLLDGGTGKDTLIGGRGDDIYIVDNTGDVVIEAAGEGTDTVRASISYTLAANVENLELTGNASLNGTGNALNNTLRGNSGSNILDGGAGNDLLVGGAGSDTYRYGRGYGNDIIDNSGGSRNDVDTLQLNDLNAADIRLFRIGNDLVLTTLADGATLTVRQYFVDADHQIDRIRFAGGAIWNASDITANLWFPAIPATSGNDQLNGNPTDDLLQGLGGNDRLFGYGGNDTLDGGTGADYMAGGIGNDIYIVDNALDTVVEAAGEGNDTVRSSISYTLGANVENLELTGNANLNGTGNSLDNRLTGNSGNNLLDGGAGKDTMAGGRGDDIYIVDNAGDVVTEAAGEGTDTVRASISYTLAANVENLELTGSANLNGTGNALNNTLRGNSGNNILDGKGGNDLLIGGTGNDTYRYGLGYGNDIIDNSGGGRNDVDTLQLFDLNPAAVSFTRAGNNLVVVVRSTLDTVTVKDFYLAADREIDRVQFADGTVWNNAAIKAAAASTGNIAPVSTDDSITMQEDSTVLLRVSDFGNYQDAEQTPLAAVQITALPGAGSLQYFNGSNWQAVTLNQVISRAALDAGFLRFTPAANANGASYTGIGFKVGDGTGFAQTANQLTINVTAVNDAPTGGLTINGRAAEGQLLTLSHTLADADGLGTVQCQWQVSVDGQNWININGANEYRYTVASADVGKYLRAVASYTDGGGTLETVTSIASAAVTSQNHNPTVSGPVTLPAGQEDTAVTLTAAQLLANAHDVDNGDVLHVQSVTVNPADGILVDNGNGTWSFTPTLNHNGVVNFTLVIADVAGATVNTAATLNLAAVNDAPTVSGPVTLPAGVEDTAVTLTAAQLLANAHDVDSSDVLHVQSVTVNPADGTLVDNGNGTWSFTPAANHNGAVSFTVVIADSAGATLNTAATLNLAAVNDAPTVSGPVILPAGVEDNAVTLTAAQLLANAHDVDNGDVLHVQSVSVNPADGTLVDNGNGTWSFTPAANHNGAVSFTVVIADSAGATLNTAATLNLAAVNDAPTVSGSVTLPDGVEDKAITLTSAQLLANAHDVDSGDVLHVQSVSVSPADGILVDNGNGTWSFTPAANHNGAVNFTVVIADSAGSTVNTEATLSLAAVNDAPTGGVSLSGSAAEGQVLTASNTLADADGLGTVQYQWQVSTDGQSWSDISGATGDSYTLTSGDAGKYLRAAASYTDGGGTLETVTSVASAAVVSQNHSPIVSGPVTLPAGQEDTAVTLTTAQLLANAQDVDSGDVLHVQSVSVNPADGALVDNGNGTWSFTPAADHNGAVSFTVVIADSAGATANTAATLNLAAVNDAPTVSGSVTLPVGQEDTALTLTAAQLLANAHDVDSGDVLHVQSVSVNPADGTLVDNHDGTWSFTPAVDRNGIINFSVIVADSAGATVNTAATLNLAAVNDAPTVSGPVTLPAGQEDTAVTLTAAQLLANAQDVDNGDVLHVQSVTVNPADGTLVDNGNGTWSFTPTANHNGAINFTVVIADVAGAIVTTAATLNLAAVNDAPTVSGPVTLPAGQEDTAVTLTAAQLLANTHDVDNGDVLHVQSVSVNSADGTLVDNGNGTWSFTPAADHNGAVSFTVVIADSAGATVNTAATLNLAAVNDAPTVSGSVTLPVGQEDTALTLTAAQLLANAHDVDSGDVLHVQSVSVNPADGTLVDNGNGTWSFTPAADRNGDVSFTVVITDSAGSTVNTEATLSLAAVNDAPTGGVSLSGSAAEDQVLTVSNTLADADGLGPVQYQWQVSTDGQSWSNISGATGDSYTLTSGDAGKYLRAAASYTDGGGTLETVTSVASAAVVSQNHSPTVSGPVTLPAGQEDTAVTLTAAQLLANAHDVDSGDVLHVQSVSVSPADGILVDNHDGTWSFTPAADRNGIINFSVIVTDSAGATVNTAATLNLAAVNDAPTVSGPVTLPASQEDIAVTLTAAQLLANAHDVDNGDVLHVQSVSVSPADGTLVDNHDGTWSFTPAADRNGIINFSVIVADSAGSTVNTEATLSLAAVNDAPTGGVSLSGSAAEGQVLTASNTLADADGLGPVQYQWQVSTDGQSWSDISGATGDSYTLTSGDAGKYLRAAASYTDGGGTLETVTSVASAAVVSQNHSPTVSGPVTLPAGQEDTAVTLTAAQLLANAQDVDSGDVLHVQSVSVNPADGALVDNGDGTWSFTPAANHNGAVNFTVVIADVAGATVTTAATINLAAVNDAPTVSGPVTLPAGQEDTAMTLTVAQLLANAHDVDSGDVLHVQSVTVNPADGTLVDNGNGTWSFTPTANHNGAINFTVVIADVAGAIVTTAATLNLAAVNDAPTVSGPVTLPAGQEDTAVTLTAAQLLANAHDVDNGDVLHVQSVSVSPADGTLVDNGNGTWSFTPAADHNGAVSFTVVIADSAGATVNTAATLNLVAVNDAPTVSGPVTLPAGVEDTAVTLTAAQLLANAHDVDSGDVLHVQSVSVSPADGILVDNGNGTWSFTPALNHNGAVSFAVVIADSAGATVNTAATLNLAAVNDAPTVSGPVTLPVGQEDTALTLTAAQLLANAHDVDNGDVLHVQSVSVNPADGTLVDNGNGTWSFTPAADHNGAVSFTVVIADSAGATVNTAATLNLAAVNDAPTVSGSVTLPVGQEDTALTLTAAQLLANAHDVDSGDVLHVQSVSVNPADGILVDNGNGTWSFTPALNHNGAVSFAVVIADSAGATVNTAATLNLAPVNDAPTGGVSLNGNAAEGQVLTASNTLADADGLGTVQYQWQVSTDGQSWSNISGATGDSYTLTSGDAGKYLRAAASYTDGGGTTETVYSAASTAVATPNHIPTVSGPVILPDGVEDKAITLTAAQLLANAHDVDNGDVLHVQSVSVNPADGTLVDNHDGTWSFTPAADRNGTINFSVIVVDNAGATVNTAATLNLAAVNDAPTGGVSLSGNAAEGQVLTVSNTLVDADGLGTIQYQWQVSVDGQSWSNISGAIGNSYKVASGDAGKYLRAAASYTDGGGKVETVASTAVTAVGPQFQLIPGTAGDDVLTGGAGLDSVRYNGNLGQYTFTNDPTGIITVSGPEGNDRLISIEQVQFADSVLTISGHPGGEMMANTTTLTTTSAMAIQQYSSVTALKDGGYLVSWASNQGGTYDIFTQRYSADGSLSGAETRVNTTTSLIQQQPSVTALSDGGYLVSWSSNHSGSYDIYTQRYRADGTTNGVETRVNATTAGDQLQPNAVAFSDGSYLVSWSIFQNGSYDIYLQRYNANGSTLGGETRVNTNSAGAMQQPGVTALSDGSYVVSWFSSQAGSNDVYTQRYRANGTAIGGETRVNTTLNGDQQQVSVTALKDGGYLVSWSSDQNGNYDIFTQRYHADGTLNGGETRVSSTAAGFKYDITVTALNDGGYIVGWQSNQNGNNDVFTQRFSADGQAYGGETRANSTSTGEQQQVSIAGLNDGGYVVSWTSSQNGNNDIFIQRYDVNGNAVTSTLTLYGDASDNIIRLGNGNERVQGGEGNDTFYGGLGTDSAVYRGNQHDFVINASSAHEMHITDQNSTDGNEGSDTLYDIENVEFGDGIKLRVVSAETRANSTSAGTQQQPSVTTLKDGSYLVSWSSDQNGTYDIYTQRYHADGSLYGAETLVNTTLTGIQQQPSVTALNDGGYLVSWTSSQSNNNDIYIQRYNADGSLNGVETRVNTSLIGDQQQPSVTALKDGGYLVTWLTSPNGNTEINLQRYNADGTPNGVETLVNTTTPGNQSLPSVTALKDGGYLVSWYSTHSNLGSTNDIYIQRYRADGSLFGGETRVNTSLTSTQSQPSVTALNDGGYVVSWQSNHSGNYDIYVQRYNADGSLSGVETRVNTTILADQVEPSIATLSNGGYVVSWTSFQNGNYNIYAQRYRADGSPDGGETQVTNGGNHQQSSVTALSDGGYLVSWHTTLNGNVDISTQRYDAGGNKVLDHLEWSGTAGNDVIRGSALNDWIAAGTGNDTYLYGRGQGSDVIDNRNAGSSDNDVIVFDSDINPAEVAVSQDGNDLLLNLKNSQDSIRVLDYFSGGAAQVDEIRFGNGVTWKPQNIEEILHPVEDTTPPDAPQMTIIDDVTGLVVSSGYTSDATPTFRGNSEANAWIHIYDNGSSTPLATVQADENGYWQYTPATDLALGYHALTVTATDTAGNVSNTSSFNLNVGTITSVINGDDNANVPLTGTELADVIDAKGGNDQLFGLGGNDVLIGGAGDDLLDGGAGTDTARYQGNQRDFRVSIQGPHQLTVTDLNVADGDEGQDSLHDIEQVQFGDGISLQIVSEATSEILANSPSTSTLLNHQQPSITGLADGGYVVSWVSYGQDGDNYGIYTQRYDALGTPQGDERQVNNTTLSLQSESQITALADGGYVVSWTSNNGSAGGNWYDIYTRRYDASGQPLGVEERVNTITADDQELSGISALSDGGYVVSWLSIEDNGEDYVFGLYTRRFNADGVAQGEEVRVGSMQSDYHRPGITSLAEGGYVVGWVSDGNGYVQHYGADGTAQGPLQQINSEPLNDAHIPNPAIAALADGGYVVSWTSFNPESGIYDIHAQRYNAAGVAQGNEQWVGTNAYGDITPSVTGLVNGGYVVSWTFFNQAEFDLDIYTRRYDAHGQPVGDEQLISVNTLGSQFDPSVSALADGGYVVSWTLLGKYGEGWDVYSQCFDADGNPQITRLQWTGTDQNDQLRGSAGIDILSGGMGDDTYLYGRGQGLDVIDNRSAAVGDKDAILFDHDISSDQVTAERVGNDLLLRVDPQDSVRVVDYFAGGPAQVAEIRFGNGTVWTPGHFASLFNQPPTASSDSLTTAKDIPVTLSLNDFGNYHDAEGVSLVAVKISALPDNGQLEHFSGGEWTAVSLNQMVTAADIQAGLLRFVPTQGTPGDQQGQIWFQVSDGDALSTDTYTLNLTATWLEGVPTAVLPQGTEDGAYQINRADLLAGLRDANGGDSLLVDYLFADHGSFEENANGTGWTFTPEANFHGDVTLYYWVSNASGDGTYESMTFNLASVNDAPVITSDVVASIAENSPVNTVVYTATATDVDEGDTSSWSLTGTDAALLQIDAHTGAVTLKSPANFEAKSSYSFSVVNTDSGGASSSQAVTLNVTDVNEAPSAITFNNVTTAINENVVVGSGIKVAGIDVADDALGTVKLSLSGTDAASFKIIGNDLYYIGASPDFEVKSSYNVVVNADDPTVGNTPDVSKSFTLNINDMPEDSTPPRVTSITSSVVFDSKTTVATITITFSEAVVGFDLSDLSATKGLFTKVTKVSDTVYTADWSRGSDGGGKPNVTVSAGYQDLAGNPGTAFTQSFPAGTAGEPINLALKSPLSAVGGLVTLLVGVMPEGWLLNNGSRQEDGSWIVQTRDPGALAVITPADYAGAVVLAVSMSWIKADGTTEHSHIASNIEAYAPGNPVFALSQDDNLTGSSGADHFVFTQVEGHYVIYNFDTTADKIDFTGSGVSSMDDVQITRDAQGFAVISVGEGQSITLKGIDTAALSGANFAFGVVPEVHNTGVLHIGDGAAMPFAGNIINSGTMTLDASDNTTQMEILAPGATLSGGGHLLLSDNDGNVVSGVTEGITLTNVDNIISGAGQLGAGSMALVNQGTIIADGHHRLLIDSGDQTITNSGVLEATGQGGMVVESILDNSGLLWANGGDLTLNKDVSGTGSALISGTATLEYGAASTLDTHFDFNGDGTLKLDDAASFTGTVSGFNAGDTLELGDLSGFTLSYTNNATATGGILTISDGVRTSNIALQGTYTAAGFQGAHAGSSVTYSSAVGDQVLVGTAGNEGLVGGDGNDVLNGIGGDDVLVGGAGSDTFVLQFNNGVSTIFDFSNARVDHGGDVLYLDGLFEHSGNTSLSDSLSLREENGNTILSVIQHGVEGSQAYHDVAILQNVTGVTLGQLQDNGNLNIIG